MTAVPVARLSIPATTDCPMCGQRAQWSVGPDERSCDRCLPAVLRAVLASGDGFAPPIVTPVRGAR